MKSVFSPLHLLRDGRCLSAHFGSDAPDTCLKLLTGMQMQLKLEEKDDFMNMTLSLYFSAVDHMVVSGGRQTEG